MSKVKKPHDETGDEDSPGITFDLVDEVDYVMDELTEFVRQAVLKSRHSISGRRDVFQIVARLMQRFSGSIHGEAIKEGDHASLVGIVDRLLSESDQQFAESYLAIANSPEGTTLLDEHLSRLPFPHYEPNPDDETTVIRVLEDGTKTVGRFVDRKFVAADNA